MADDFTRHVSLRKASVALAERAPEWAFSERELREMCEGYAVPFLTLPSKGLVHKCRYFVCPEKLVKFFMSKENKYVK